MKFCSAVRSSKRRRCSPPRDPGFYSCWRRKTSRSWARLNDLYRIASELPQLGVHGVLVAFVGRRPDRQAINNLGETAAANRGMSGRILNAAAEIEQWRFLV